MPDIAGPRLLDRLQSLTRSKVMEYKSSVPDVERILRIAGKLAELVRQGHISSYLAVESAFHFLHEKSLEDESRLDEYVRDIQDFVL